MPWPHSNDLGKNPPISAKPDPVLQNYADWFEAESSKFKAKVLGQMNEPQSISSLDQLIKYTYEAPLIQPSHNYVVGKPPVGPPITKVFTSKGHAPMTHNIRFRIAVDGLNLKDTVFTTQQVVSDEYLATSYHNPLEVAEAMLDRQLAEIKIMIMSDLKKKVSEK